MPTLPKIKVFLWKSLSEALPTTDLLRSRGMKGVNRCQTFGEETESINHILFDCTFARLVWARSSIPHPKNGFSGVSIYTNMNYLFTLRNLNRLREEDKRVWPWILWNLWKKKNEMCFEGRCLTAVDLVRKAYEEAAEWLVAQAIEKEWTETEQTKSTKEPRKWTPPDPGWVMCNIGMDYSKKKGLVGGAWVLRNERGVVMCHSRRASQELEPERRQSL